MRRDLSDEFDQPRNSSRLTAFRGNMACTSEDKIPAFASAFEHEPTTRVCATAHQNSPTEPILFAGQGTERLTTVGVPCANTSWVDVRYVARPLPLLCRRTSLTGCMLAAGSMFKSSTLLIQFGTRPSSARSRRQVAPNFARAR